MDIIAMVDISYLMSVSWVSYIIAHITLFNQDMLRLVASQTINYYLYYSFPAMVIRGIREFPGIWNYFTGLRV